jgi:trigger factor
LKIETTPRDDHQATMTVEVDAEQLEAARRRAARKIAGQAKIPGFRPGKAPYDVVRRMYGDSAITEEAVEILVNDIYPLAIKEADINPAAIGQLENVESLDPPKFVFTVPLAPKVELGDYKSIRIPYEWTSPDDDKLEHAISELRRMYSTTEQVERAAQEGDFVLVDVSGVKAKPKDGEENTPLVERNGHATLIRKEEKEDEWPFPGFATKLVGLQPGEETSFTHKFAKDHADEALQGQNVKFTVKVKTIRGVNMPELDDSFAQKTGLGMDVDELRKRMRENLEAEARAEYDDKYFEQAIDQIKAGATIKYPPQVLEHEIEHVIEDIERRLKSQGVDNMDTYYKMVNTTAEQFLEEQAKPVALRRLERGLIMDEIARAEDIKLDEESIEHEFQHAWTNLVMNDPEFNKRTKGGTKPTREIVDAVAMDSANRLLTRRVLDQIKAIANGEAAADGEAPVEKAKPSKGKKTAPKAAKTDEAQSEESAAVVEAEGESKPVKKKPAAKKKSE